MKKKLPIFLCLFGTSILLMGQTQTENYIKSKRYKVETSQTISNPNAEQGTINITYIDGLGRPKQQVAHRQSGNGGDMVTHIEYDGLGRQPKEYLPYSRSASQNMDGSARASTVSFYNVPGFGNTANPWSEKDLEESPLNSVLRQAAPGNDWAMDMGHEIEFEQQANSANEVHHFYVLLSGNEPSLKYDGYYLTDQLYKTVTMDENHTSGVRGTVAEYKDKLGRTVLKRLFTTLNGRHEDPDPNPTLRQDTYYVYDDHGNLTFVLSPKLSDQIVSDGSLVGNHQELLDMLGYQYRYDYRNRLIHKKIPGKQREFIAYDLLDRPIATGPVLSPFGDGTEGWLRTKYDAFNRVAYTFWTPGPIISEQGRLVIEDVPAPLSESRGTGQFDNISIGYTNTVQPTSGKLLTVKYYDDYAWPGAPSSIPVNVDGQTVYYNNTTRKPKGLPTGSWTRILESQADTKRFISHILYDNKARPLRVRIDDSYGGYTQVDTQYDFMGKVLRVTSLHRKDAAAMAIDVVEEFTYTPEERLERHTHKIGRNPVQLLAHNGYDALGRLLLKKVGGIDISGSIALQTVDYKYNVRGWLTDINNVDNLQAGTGAQDLFAFKINYNGPITEDVNGLVQPLYNGNIAETSWRTASDNILRKYGYSYDYQNRLLDAWYQKPNDAIPLSNSYDEHLTYDKNGNILTLLRNGESEYAVLQIDDLQYTYNDGNRLKLVLDNTTHPAGFNDGNPGAQSIDYTYDSYGNMTVDENKGITEIVYNHLNLPTKITFGSLGTIDYLYDAAGVKLQKKVTEGTTITITDYRGAFQYVAGNLAMVHHAEGYVNVLDYMPANGDGIYNYVFNYVDHLGNIRLRYAIDPDTDEIAILEENHYYPFGLKHNGYNSGQWVFKKEADLPVVLVPVTPIFGDTYKYKFQGVELNESLGLNLYEMDLRQYDPAIGRFNSIDIVTHFSQSPFTAFDNNPIYWADPAGADSESFFRELFENSNSGTTWTNTGNGIFSDGNGNTAQCDDCDESEESQEQQNPNPFGNIQVLKGQGWFGKLMTDINGRKWKGPDGIWYSVNDEGYPTGKYRPMVIGGPGSLEYISAGGIGFLLKLPKYLRYLKYIKSSKDLLRYAVKSADAFKLVSGGNTFKAVLEGGAYGAGQFFMQLTKNGWNYQKAGNIIKLTKNGETIIFRASKSGKKGFDTFTLPKAYEGKNVDVFFK